MYKGEDVTDTPTEFRSSAPGEVDLQALFTNRVAQASGTVTDANGHPVRGAWVLAFVDGRPADLEQHSADRMAMANERGAFTLLGLMGDAYGVVAFEPQRQPPSSSLFKRLIPLATSITVTPGEARVIDLKVTELPEP
jgi:protocatechuate 3,4-dioxygenase beta subunit